jgi:hypothetical protein
MCGGDCGPRGCPTILPPRPGRLGTRRLRRLGRGRSETLRRGAGDRGSRRRALCEVPGAAGVRQRAVGADGIFGRRTGDVCAPGGQGFVAGSCRGRWWSLRRTIGSTSTVWRRRASPEHTEPAVCDGVYGECGERWSHILHQERGGRAEAVHTMFQSRQEFLQLNAARYIMYIRLHVCGVRLWAPLLAAALGLRSGGLDARSSIGKFFWLARLPMVLCEPV